jgi:nitroreductase
VDTYEAIMTRRAVRHFLNRPVPQDVLIRILQAGRWAGSSKNTQPWHFVVVRGREALDQLSRCGRYASHLQGAALAVVVVTRPGLRAAFDSGRAVQNMMLAAWSDGVGSCPAALHDDACAKAVLGVPDDWDIQMALSFGYPDPDAPAMIEGLPREKVLAEVGRRPLEEIVHWETW